MVRTLFIIDLIYRRAEHPGLLLEENDSSQDHFGGKQHLLRDELLGLPLANTEANKQWISLLDGSKELKEYLLYIIAVTTSFGGPVSCWELPWAPASLCFWRGQPGGRLVEKPPQELCEDLSIFSLGNGTNDREHHGGLQHLKMEKSIRSF